ncbi:Uncharacterised protein [Bordetella pertussis]|nr:Uncharacterised protein [Bordetella pertussis]CFO35986.1 Uncharacterised protein [Bordetella pertussis]CPO77175.1 Uncharacterised protein [Bordetella pertussis]
MAQEGDARQRRRIAQPVDLADQALRERHRAQPEQAHPAGEHIQHQRRQRHGQQQQHAEGAQTVNRGQQQALAVDPAQLAGIERADHVAQADQRDGGGAMAGLHAGVDHVGRQVQRDERGVKTADEIAPRQEVERRMRHRLAHRCAQRLLHAAVHAGLAAQEIRQGRAHGHQQRQHPQRAGPVQPGNQLLPGRHHQELAQRTACAGDAHGRAAIGRRHRARHHRQDHGEGGPRLAQPHQHPGRQVQGGLVGGETRAYHAQRIQHGAQHDGAARSVAVGQDAHADTGGAPDQVLQGERHREHFAPPAVRQVHGLHEQPERGAHPHGQQHHAGADEQDAQGGFLGC